MILGNWPLVEQYNVPIYDSKNGIRKQMGCHFKDQRALILDISEFMIVVTNETFLLDLQQER